MQNQNGAITIRGNKLGQQTHKRDFDLVQQQG